MMLLTKVEKREKLAGVCRNFLQNSYQKKLQPHIWLNVEQGQKTPKSFMTTCFWKCTFIWTVHRQT